MSSKVQIGDRSEGQLLKLAKKLTEQKTAKTKIFDEEAEKQIPTFDISELTIGRVLGRGGFCVVSQVTRVTLKDTGRAEVAQENRKKIAKDSNTKEPCYAIKRLANDLATARDAGTFVNGIVDLALEAKWLAAIQHPHIISIKGMAVGDPCNRDFFVVLDRLHDILTMRLVAWRKHKPGGFHALTDRKGKKAAAFWLERITVARNISSALAYLHSHRVMHRDLKPDDIGFDVQGDVKLFDFGLAKEYDPSKADKNGCYKMTKGTGSMRYMAPEVGLSKPANETVDVYSFGLLLYQILSMEAPFYGLTVRSFPTLVFQKGARPVPDPKWPHSIITLMQRCWSPQISDRPSMSQVEAAISKEIKMRNPGGLLTNEKQRKFTNKDEYETESSSFSGSVDCSDRN